MNWNDVDAIIYDGTDEEINAVRCPECGGALKLNYNPKTESVFVGCIACGSASRQNGVTETPNFAKGAAVAAAM